MNRLNIFLEHIYEACSQNDITLQEMLLQEADGKILLFPAWPKDWNVHFKLHATGQTTVEATLKEGAVVSLTVQPKEREKDVVNCLLNK